MTSVVRKFPDCDPDLPVRGGSVKDHLPVFRRFLRIESERLRTRHRLGASGTDIVEARTGLIDHLISRAFVLAVDDAGAPPAGSASQSLVALGGYGRRELAPGSDIDLLFLHEGRAEADSVVEYLLYLLWDIGLTLGHCYRTIEQCVSLASEDLISRNALADARFLAGNPQLFAGLTSRLESALFSRPRQVERYVGAMEADLIERHKRFGPGWGVSEPNIKEGPGGLRDLQTVLWLARARFRCRSLDELRRAGHISDDDATSTAAAYDFLLKLRNELHFRTGRRTDVLSLDLQAPIATGLHCSPGRGRVGSEVLMQRYYESAHQIFRFTQDFLHKTGNRPSRRGWVAYLRKKRVFDGFDVSDGRVYLARQDLNRDRDPIWMVRAFSVAQKTGFELSVELRQAIRSSAGLVDRRFRASPEAARMFSDMLKRRGEASMVLRAMHESGFLARFLPEFGRSGFWVSRHSDNQCTVAEHSLAAVEQLERAVSDAATQETGPISPVDWLCVALALLIHHQPPIAGERDLDRVARRVGRRLHLDADSVSLLAFLVTHAGVMSHLAERRDFSEEPVLADFVRRVGTPHRLRLLFLLEQADGGAPPRRPGLLLPESLQDLYLRSHALLCPEASDRQPAAPGAAADGRIREHLKMMPAHYVRNVSPATAGRHIQLIDELEGQELVTRWHNEGTEYTGLTICTRDFAGLFARLAGTLTAAGLDILTADLNSRADGIVLDVLRVRRCRWADAVCEQMRAGIDADLRESIRPEADLDEALRRWQGRQSRYLGKRRPVEIRPSVRFDSRTSATSTVVEVRAEDRPGLAYIIARTLADLQVDIHFARITTERHYALDIFYVKGLDGAKLSSSEAVTVGRSLLCALGRTEE